VSTDEYLPTFRGQGVEGAAAFIEISVCVIMPIYMSLNIFI